MDSTAVFIRPKMTDGRRAAGAGILEGEREAKCGTAKGEEIKLHIDLNPNKRNNNGTSRSAAIPFPSSH